MDYTLYESLINTPVDQYQKMLDEGIETWDIGCVLHTQLTELVTTCERHKELLKWAKANLPREVFEKMFQDKQ